MTLSASAERQEPDVWNEFLQAALVEPKSRITLITEIAQEQPTISQTVSQDRLALTNLLPTASQAGSQDAWAAISILDEVTAKTEVVASEQVEHHGSEVTSPTEGEDYGAAEKEVAALAWQAAMEEVRVLRAKAAKLEAHASWKEINYLPTQLFLKSEAEKRGLKPNSDLSAAEIEAYDLQNELKQIKQALEELKKTLETAEPEDRLSLEMQIDLWTDRLRINSLLGYYDSLPPEFSKWIPRSEEYNEPR